MFLMQNVEFSFSFCFWFLAICFALLLCPNFSCVLFLILFSVVTEVHGRTFGVWTLLTCTLCYLCAFNLENKPLYLATFLSFVYALGHFLTEYLIYQTMAIANLSTVGFFAGINSLGYITSILLCILCCSGNNVQQLVFDIEKIYSTACYMWTYLFQIIRMLLLLLNAINHTWIWAASTSRDYRQIFVYLMKLIRKKEEERIRGSIITLLMPPFLK